MKQIEKLALKYLLIGFGIETIKLLITSLEFHFVDFFNITNPKEFDTVLLGIIRYLKNIIFGTFILFDSIKYTKNKLIISLTGFLLPFYGVCFLIIEKYLIQKLTDNE